MIPSRQDGKIVGLTAGLTPYHHARWQSFARQAKTSCVVMELTDKDEFPVMEVSRAGEASYSRLTLFPHQLESDLPASQIRKKVTQALDEQRPTCVCLNGYATPLALGALLWCIDHRVPAVMMSESAANDETRKGWKEWIKSRVIRLCSSALVGGSPHAEYMARLGLPHERIFLGYDAVDNDYFTLGAQKARADAAKLRLSHHLPPNYFMASARFVPKKNLPRLLEAFAHYLRLVPAGHEPWSLVLLGDGAERDALLKLRQNLGLEKAVHLVGAKSYKELPIYYGLASAFVHASTTEQWGLVVNEAMASGLPVLVSSRCGSTPDLVHDGINGFLFAPLDVEDLARKMLNLTQSRDRLSTYGLASQNIIADWSPARFARGLTQAIEIAQTNTLPRPTWLDRLLLSILIHQ